jgi:L-amino acid N-acyltransferase YncA
MSIDEAEIRFYPPVIIFDWNPMKQNLRVVRGREIRKEDLVQIIALNHLVYGPEATASLENVERVLAKNGETCLVVWNEARGKVVGYMSALPLVPEAFQRILDEESEEFLDTDDVVEYDFSDPKPKFYHLYLASVVVETSCQRSGIFRLLYVSFLDALLALGRENSIFFRDLAARTLPQGEKICLALGMNQLGNSCRNEKIYYSEMPPPFLGQSSGKGKELVRFSAEALQRG